MTNDLAIAILQRLLDRPADCQCGNMRVDDSDAVALDYAIGILKQPSKAGSVTSARKAESSRLNGLKGGRPRKNENAGHE